MGNKTNTSRAFYSAYRVGHIVVQDAINERLDKSIRRSSAATEKQIAYIEALQSFCIRHGRKDFPTDSKYKGSNIRASKLIEQLNWFVSANGLRKVLDEEREENDR